MLAPPPLWTKILVIIASLLALVLNCVAIVNRIVDGTYLQIPMHVFAILACSIISIMTLCPVENEL